MLYRVTYHVYVDFFTADSFTEALQKARILSCGADFTLSIVQ